jgi:hypothetical protein
VSQVRAERVADGSRRKRDLAAVDGKAPIEIWADEHLPGESHYAVAAIHFRLKKQHRPVTAESVREGLRERGWLKEQNS